MGSDLGKTHFPSRSFFRGAVKAVPLRGQECRKGSFTAAAGYGCAVAGARQRISNQRDIRQQMRSVTVRNTGWAVTFTRDSGFSACRAKNDQRAHGLISRASGRYTIPYPVFPVAAGQVPCHHKNNGQLSCARAWIST